MSTESAPPGGPLKGLKVLDTSTMYAAPMIATLLADHGADVIKVEPPGGDPYRAHPAMWTVVARNKGSVVLDLKTDADCDRLRRMIPGIDVIVVNMPPALLKRRGLDYDTLSALNPGLVMAHFSGYGLTGPYAARAGNGTVSEAFAGYTNMTGEADGPPVMASVPLGDGLSAFSGAFGVMAACYQRMHNGGRGALIDVTPIDAVLQVPGIVLILRTAQDINIGAGFSKAQPLKTKFVVASGGSGQMLSLPMNEAIQQMFKDVYIDLEFKVVELEALYTAWRAGAKAEMNKDVTANNIAYVTSDPLYAFTRFFASNQGAPVGVNWSNYASPEVDKLIDEALAQFDPARQDALMARVHEKVVDDAVLIWVVHDTNPHALSPKIKSYIQAQHWFQDLTTIGV